MDRGLLGKKPFVLCNNQTEWNVTKSTVDLNLQWKIDSIQRISMDGETIVLWSILLWRNIDKWSLRFDCGPLYKNVSSTRYKIFNDFHAFKILDRFIDLFTSFVKFSKRMWFMVKVTFGDHDTCNSGPSLETRNVGRSISRRSIFNVVDNDIALLRLTERVPFKQFIRPICLPQNKRMTLQNSIAT